MQARPAFLKDIERLVLFDSVCNLCNRNIDSNQSGDLN
jgi:predicted DCC family thiol-disulfide oxidoreductase YuxK